MRLYFGRDVRDTICIYPNGMSVRNVMPTDSFMPSKLRCFCKRGELSKIEIESLSIRNEEQLVVSPVSLIALLDCSLALASIRQNDLCTIKLLSRSTNIFECVLWLEDWKG